MIPNLKTRGQLTELFFRLREDIELVDEINGLTDADQVIWLNAKAHLNAAFKGITVILSQGSEK